MRRTIGIKEVSVVKKIICSNCEYLGQPEIAKKGETYRDPGEL